MPQPVICAVNGAAIGGGMCLALGGDIRIAAESAYFRAAGINNGLTATELGMSFLLPRAIGASRAFEIMLSGRDVTAREAAEIGLVSRVVPDAELLPAALDLADQINGWSPQGVQLTKRMMWAGLETGSLQAAIELESHTQLYVRLTTKNFEEATRARKEGRKPVFEDSRSDERRLQGRRDQRRHRGRARAHPERMDRAGLALRDDAVRDARLVEAPRDGLRDLRAGSRGAVVGGRQRRFCARRSSADRA